MVVKKIEGVFLLNSPNDSGLVVIVIENEIKTNA